MTRALPFLLPLLLICSSAFGQDADSAAKSTSPAIQPSTVVGASLVAAGTAITFVPALQGINTNVRDAVWADGHGKLTFDNYLQYAPAAIPLAMKVCGVEGSRSSLRDMLALAALSYTTGFLVVEGVKHAAGVQRPDARSNTSFPSGHTFTAFTGAEILRQEYGHKYPAVAVGGYALATLTAAMRIYNNRHWVADVLAGAGVGILCVDFSYWVGDKLIEASSDRKARRAELEAMVSEPVLLSF
ncbi:MAG: phosphatase PAP2 family protein [Bacteroidales bacterium]|nr:phosphatase PAP2 family protein [Bacteroidales bacterium]